MRRAPRRRRNQKRHTSEDAQGARRGRSNRRHKLGCISDYADAGRVERRPGAPRTAGQRHRHALDRREKAHHRILGGEQEHLQPIDRTTRRQLRRGAVVFVSNQRFQETDAANLPRFLPKGAEDAEYGPRR